MIEQQKIVGVQLAEVVHPQKDLLKKKHVEGQAQSILTCFSVGGLLSAPWPEDKLACRILDEIPQAKGWREADYVIFG